MRKICAFDMRRHGLPISTVLVDTACLNEFKGGHSLPYSTVMVGCIAYMSEKWTCFDKRHVVWVLYDNDVHRY